MIYYLNGPVTVLEPGLAVVECGGVGYGCRITAFTAAQLKLNQTARLYICESIREDAHDLYGFYSREEQHCYELLTSVTGVGPKAAISILSAVSPADLAMAVVTENEKALTAAKGIGKKIAQRIILELKDKVAKETAIPASRVGITMPQTGGKLNEVTEALSVLGYTPQEIGIILRDPDIAAMSTEDIIRQALKNSLK